GSYRTLRHGDPFRIAGTLDGDVELPARHSVGSPRLDAPRGEQGQFGVVPPDHEQRAAGERERLRHELAELPVAHHEHAIAGVDPNLLLDLKRGGERLGEHGGVRGHGVRDRVQVLGRQDQAVGECAVPAHDAEHRAALAVGTPARETRAARPAHGVDLTDDAAADERRRTLLDDADELVARDPGERVVPARELDIGVADSRAQYADERFARGRLGDRNVLPYAQAAIL